MKTVKRMAASEKCIMKKLRPFYASILSCHCRKNSIFSAITNKDGNCIPNQAAIRVFRVKSIDSAPCLDFVRDRWCGNKYHYSENQSGSACIAYKPLSVPRDAGGAILQV